MSTTIQIVSQKYFLRNDQGNPSNAEADSDEGEQEVLEDEIASAMSDWHQISPTENGG